MTDPEPNPYAAPQADPSGLKARSKSPRNPLKIPAVCLVVLAMASTIYFSRNLYVFFNRRGKQLLELSSDMPMVGLLLAFFLTAMAIALVILNLIVIAGSLHMFHLKSFRKARRAAIISCIPICTPLMILGLPFGIWAFVLLLRPSVRARFSDPSSFERNPSFQPDG